MADMGLYRRHRDSCPGKRRGRTYTKCKCPVWCDGRVDGRRVHQSMKTKDWDRAERRLLGSFDPGSPVLNRQPLADAIQAFLADCRARHLQAATMTSYVHTLGCFREFCEASAAKHADQVTLDVVTAFRASRKGRDGKSPMKPSSQRKEMETLRAFCAFCVQRDWMKNNPALKVKHPRETGSPTLPFEQTEIDAILAACDKIENNYRASAERARLRARALILLLLYSGLRIGDAAALECRHLGPGGKLRLRTMKTGAPLYVTLPDSVVSALEAVAENERYFFWSGRGKLSSIVGSLRRTVECVLKLAGVKGHPHRFRDTFAVRLLEHDTPIRTVQLLLGHSSVQTTERHYAPFVKSQQRLLDAATAQLNFETGPKPPARGESPKEPARAPAGSRTRVSHASDPS